MEVRAIYEALAAEGFRVVLYSDDLCEKVVEDYRPEFDDKFYGSDYISSIDFYNDAVVIYCRRPRLI